VKKQLLEQFINHNSSGFEVKLGMHQGSALIPLLFVIVMEAISREFRVALPWELLYADDLDSCFPSPGPTSVYFYLFVMVALCNRADHYIFILFLSFFFFFPRLISAVGNWMFTILWHMMWP